jgi:hypothetical protein
MLNFDLQGNTHQVKLLKEVKQGFEEKYLRKDFCRVVCPKTAGGLTLDKEGWLKHVATLGTGYLYPACYSNLFAPG